MKFIKITLTLSLSIILQNLPLAVEAQTPPLFPPSVTEMTFSNPTKYCFYQGELGGDRTDLSGDLKQITLKYRLIVPPEDQDKPKNIFVAFRRYSIPDVLWLFGLKNSGPEWVQYDPKQPPVVYPINRSYSPFTELDIISKPTDLTQFKLDGEVFVGYGLKANDNAATSSTDSFQEMIEHKRFKRIWLVDGSSPKLFGTLFCIPFTTLNAIDYGF
ncbi:MAG: hypothetical protein HOP02_08975 [Methylococcaceae bacterium]|nr:hypothetical protein [Methylococcaceae bacterium]